MRLAQDMRSFKLLAGNLQIGAWNSSDYIDDGDMCSFLCLIFIAGIGQ
jgi:hypothetical protein